MSLSSELPGRRNNYLLRVYFLLMLFCELITFSAASILIPELLCFFLRAMSFCFLLLVHFGCSFFLNSFCFKPPPGKTPFQIPSPIFCHQAKLPALVSNTMYISKTVWSKIVSVSWNCFPFLCHPRNHPGFYLVLEFWFSLFLILINAFWEQGSNNNKMPSPPPPLPPPPHFSPLFLCTPRSKSKSKSPSTRHAFCYSRLPIS